MDILKVHTMKVKLSPEVRLEQVAALTPGFTGADLVGQAFVAAALAGCDPVHKISIIPRGISALGHTMQRPTEDRYLMTRGELENKMAVLLGGRAAEHLVFGHLSTGAAADLVKATQIARDMMTRFGMGAQLGPVTYDAEPAGFLGQVAGVQRLYAEETAREIDVAVRDAIQAQFKRARRVLAGNRKLLDETAKTLLARETLGNAELAGVLHDVQREEPRIAATAALPA